jgi:hypothetical protein
MLSGSLRKSAVASKGISGTDVWAAGLMLRTSATAVNRKGRQDGVNRKERKDDNNRKGRKDDNNRKERKDDINRKGRKDDIDRKGRKGRKDCKGRKAGSNRNACQDREASSFMFTCRLRWRRAGAG